MTKLPRHPNGAKSRRRRTRCASQHEERDAHHDEEAPGDGLGARPEAGAGSAAWLEEFRESQIQSAAVGSFFGSLLGKFLEPRGASGELPLASWNNRGELCITPAPGVSIVIDRRRADQIAGVIQGRALRYHLGTSDEDLP